MAHGNTAFPDDLCAFFTRCRLMSYIEAFKKNLIFAFADGLCVAKLILAVCPSIIDYHKFSPECSLLKRLSNWQLLNNEVFHNISISCTEDEINAIVKYKVTKDSVITFLRILRDKLDSIHTTHDYNNDNHTLTNVKFTAETKKILKKMESRVQINQRTALLSEEEIDNLYLQLSMKVKHRGVEVADKVRKLEDKSSNLNSIISQVRVENMKEMKQVEKRLHQLKLQLERIEQGDYTYNATTEVSLLYNDFTQTDQEFVKAVQLLSKEIADMNINAKHYGSIATVTDTNTDNSKAINMAVRTKISKSKAISGFGSSNNSCSNSSSNSSSSKNVESAEAWESKLPNKKDNKKTVVPTVASARTRTNGNDLLDEESIQPIESVFIPSMHMRAEHLERDNSAVHNTQAMKGTSSSHTSHGKHNDSPQHSHHAQAIITHKRILNSNLNRYYYQCVNDGSSSWVMPGDAIISCLDDSKDEYFIIVKNGKQVETAYALSKINVRL